MEQCNLRLCFKILRESKSFKNVDGEYTDNYFCIKIPSNTYNVKHSDYLKIINSKRDLLSTTYNIYPEYIIPITLNEYLDKNISENII